MLKKKFGEELETEYKLPKITKKYKGEIQQVRIPNNIQSLLKTRASMTLVAGLTGVTNRIRSGSSGTAPAPTGSPLVLGEGAGGAKTKGSAAAPFNRQMSEPPPRSDAVAPSGRSSNSGLSKVFLDPADKRSNSVLDAEYANRSTGASGSGKLQRSLTETPSNGGGNSDRKPTPALAKFARLPTVAKNIRASFSNRNSLTAASSENQSTSTASMSEGPGSESSSVSRRYIPYSIIRSQGTIAKQEPDKNAPGKVLGHGVRVFVMCRKVMSDGAAWLKTSEGWIQEKNGGVNRVLIPAIHGQPIGNTLSLRFDLFIRSDRCENNHYSV